MSPNMVRVLQSSLVVKYSFVSLFLYWDEGVNLNVIKGKSKG